MLTAGLGTRLQPLTYVRAKPAIPVAGEPLVRRILRELARQGVTEAVLNLHHLPVSIARVLGDGRDLGVATRFSWEQPQVLGSAGGPRLALPLIGSDPFFIVNGDTLTDVSLSGIAEAHRVSGAIVTMALTPNHDYLRYGGIVLDDDARVTGFVRRGPQALGSFHFVGVQVARHAAFRSIALGSAANTVGEVYDRLIKEQPGCIRGFVAEASFHDIGTVADYLNTSRALGNGQLSATGSGCDVNPTATMIDSILWDNVNVGAGCRLEHCIVTDGVHVPAGSTHRHEILLASDAGVVAVPIVATQNETAT